MNTVGRCTPTIWVLLLCVAVLHIRGSYDSAIPAPNVQSTVKLSQERHVSGCVWVLITGAYAMWRYEAVPLDEFVEVKEEGLRVVLDGSETDLVAGNTTGLIPKYNDTRIRRGWIHFCASFSNESVTVFVDGEQVTKVKSTVHPGEGFGFIAHPRDATSSPRLADLIIGSGVWSLSNIRFLLTSYTLSSVYTILDSVVTYWEDPAVGKIQNRLVGNVELISDPSLSHVRAKHHRMRVDSAALNGDGRGYDWYLENFNVLSSGATVWCWVRPTGFMNCGNGKGICSRTPHTIQTVASIMYLDSSPAAEFGFALINDTVYAYYKEILMLDKVYSKKPIEIDTWIHLCVTIGINVTIYGNGEPISDPTFANLITFQGIFSVGVCGLGPCKYNRNHLPYIGYVADVGMAATQISQQQIRLISLFGSDAIIDSKVWGIFPSSTPWQLTGEQANNIMRDPELIISKFGIQDRLTTIGRWPVGQPLICIVPDQWSIVLWFRVYEYVEHIILHDQDISLKVKDGLLQLWIDDFIEASMPLSSEFHHLAVSVDNTHYDVWVDFRSWITGDFMYPVDAKTALTVLNGTTLYTASYSNMQIMNRPIPGDQFLVDVMEMGRSIIPAEYLINTSFPLELEFDSPINETTDTSLLWNSNYFAGYAGLVLSSTCVSNWKAVLPHNLPVAVAFWSQIRDRTFNVTIGRITVSLQATYIVVIDGESKLSETPVGLQTWTHFYILHDQTEQNVLIMVNATTLVDVGYFAETRVDQNVSFSSSNSILISALYILNTSFTAEEVEYLALFGARSPFAEELGGSPKGSWKKSSQCDVRTDRELPRARQSLRRRWVTGPSIVNGFRALTNDPCTVLRGVLPEKYCGGAGLSEFRGMRNSKKELVINDPSCSHLSSDQFALAKIANGTISVSSVTTENLTLVTCILKPSAGRCIPCGFGEYSEWTKCVNHTRTRARVVQRPPNCVRVCNGMERKACDVATPSPPSNITLPLTLVAGGVSVFIFALIIAACIRRRTKAGHTRIINSQMSTMDTFPKYTISSQESVQRWSSLSSDSSTSTEQIELVDTETGEKFFLFNGRILGRGGFACVYFGLDTVGVPVAIKGLPYTQTDHKKQQAELAIMKSIVHENVVLFRGYCFTEKVLYIIMEWVPQTILSLTGGKCTVDQARSYMFHVLKGLACLHQSQIAHCDIKPVNILVTANGVAKLADFGISKKILLENELIFDGARPGVFPALHSNTDTNFEGTLRYMAPESFRKSFSEKTDIWSFGLTLLQMVTGQPPWSGLTDWEVVSRLIVENGAYNLVEHTFPEDTPPQLLDVVEQTLKWDPAQRPSANDLFGMQFFLEAS